MVEKEETRDNFWTIRQILGEYEWQPGMTKWSRTKKAQSYVDTTANLSMNLDGIVCWTYVPASSDSDFWFYNNMETYRNLVFYQTGDMTGNTRKQLSCKIKYLNENGVDVIQILDNEGNRSYGKFSYDLALKSWILAGN